MRSFDFSHISFFKLSIAILLCIGLTLPAIDGPSLSSFHFQPTAIQQPQLNAAINNGVTTRQVAQDICDPISIYQTEFNLFDSFLFLSSAESKKSTNVNSVATHKEGQGAALSFIQRKVHHIFANTFTASITLRHVQSTVILN